MGIRGPKNAEQLTSFNAVGERMMGRIYLTWLIGVFIGALQLKIEKFNAGGFEFAMGKQELLQGMIFTACIACYFALILVIFFMGLSMSLFSTAPYRMGIYLGVGSKKTLRDWNILQRKLVIKRIAKFYIGFMRTAILIFLFFPLAHILIWNHEPLFAALNYIFFGKN